MRRSALALAVLVGLVTLVGSPGLAQTPTCTIYPPTCPVLGSSTGTTTPGGTFTLSGSGFKPFSTINIFSFPGGKLLGTFKADANGSFKAMVTLPAGFATGVYTIEARGVDPSGKTRVLASSLTVTKKVTARTGVGVPLGAALGLLAAAVVLGGVLLVRGRRGVGSPSA